MLYRRPSRVVCRSLPAASMVLWDYLGGIIPHISPWATPLPWLDYSSVSSRTVGFSPT